MTGSTGRNISKVLYYIVGLQVSKLFTDTYLDLYDWTLSGQLSFEWKHKFILHY